MGPAQCALEKSSRALSDGAQRQGSQHLKGCKMYSLSIFLLLLCLIKTVVSLSHLLSSLSYGDPERTLHCLSLSPLTPLPTAEQVLFVMVSGCEKIHTSCIRT